MAASLCAADTRTRVRKSIAKNPGRAGERGIAPANGRGAVFLADRSNCVRQLSGDASKARYDCNGVVFCHAALRR